ncbi:MAG: hypothetical protein ACI8PB_000051 [Desulforhopalus sp.]|jgi:hypothetical protein
MKLSYPIRSKFLVLCEDAVHREKVKVLNGEPLSIHLPRKGYNRSVQITISSSDNKHFHSDWNGADPTRFSARIRGAALALFNQGCFGTFQVAHHTGLLTIQKTSSNALLYKKVAKSQYTDGVRINKSFHDLFNPPNSKSFVARGESRPIIIGFSKKVFSASYLHENPSKVDRESPLRQWKVYYV